MAYWIQGSFEFRVQRCQHLPFFLVACFENSTILLILCVCVHVFRPRLRLAHIISSQISLIFSAFILQVHVTRVPMKVDPTVNYLLVNKS